MNTAVRTAVMLCALGGALPAQEPATNTAPPVVPVEAPPLPGAFAPQDLKDFDSLSESVRGVIARAAELSAMRLGYKYGSADPAAGAMDCSGTIYRVLRDAGFTGVPRQSDAIYKWVWQEARIHPVVGRSEKTFELERLRPGDLLFWTGTYKVDREVPITHVMLYLGKRRKDGRAVMFGASDGRTFEGRSCFGVGAFDFLEPRVSAGASRFVGYGPVPGIGDARSASP